MNELLLTPKEIEKFRVRKHPEFQDMHGECKTCGCITDVHGLLQAHLNKVLNQPKLNKPDSEGWWWFRYSLRELPPLNGLLYSLEVEFRNGIPYEKYTMNKLNELKGTWQRAIVPE